MKKLLLLSIVALSATMSPSAYAVSFNESAAKHLSSSFEDLTCQREQSANSFAAMPSAAVNGYFEQITQPITPTYINGAVVPSWADNWFVNVQGGASAFIGSPLGCDDLFGRMKPSLNVSLGKWHTPAIGNRLSLQGLQLKSGELTTQDYRHYHADFLWNLTPTFGIGNDGCRWDIIPFVGVGLIDNRSADTRPFAVNYGVQGRFRVINNLHITAELSNATTFRDFDGYGSARKFGDNLLSLSAGVSLTFGRNVGFKKVVDAGPYITQNEQLMAYAYGQQSRIRQLQHSNEANLQAIAELRKILAIEGLLERYANVLDGNVAEKADYPVNDYSGLNSLRRRLREAANGKDKDGRDGYGRGNNGRNGIGSDKHKHTNKMASDKGKSMVSDSIKVTFGNDYLAQIYADSECLGAPIYFFFELGSTRLVNGSQLVNLDEIARIAQKYSLIVEITGAADSATGTAAINANLGVGRSNYIAQQLAERGVDTDMCVTISCGGIDDYTPAEANRNAIVRLYLP